MNDLLQTPKHSAGGSVECLGMTFPTEDARREHFRKLLAEKLKEPEFRNQEGFPQGTAEAIIALSDPPYYTASPNPWLEDFVKRYGKPYDPAEEYSREPMALDVSVGKFDALYKAHSYHTKVPHLAIVPSLLNYTRPGDLVLDGFCGSGMTGVAAQWCGIASQSYRKAFEAQTTLHGGSTPDWGVRKTILADLSPAATFMASNYNGPADPDHFEEKASHLLKDLKVELGWMYETQVPGTGRVLMEYMVWSELFFVPRL